MCSLDSNKKTHCSILDIYKWHGISEVCRCLLFYLICALSFLEFTKCNTDCNLTRVCEFRGVFVIALAHKISYLYMYCNKSFLASRGQKTSKKLHSHHISQTYNLLRRTCCPFTHLADIKQHYHPIPSHMN